MSGYQAIAGEGLAVFFDPRGLDVKSRISEAMDYCGESHAAVQLQGFQLGDVFFTLEVHKDIGFLSLIIGHSVFSFCLLGSLSL